MRSRTLSFLLCLALLAGPATAGEFIGNVVKEQREDRYGRTLGRVNCAGVDVNAEQVAARRRRARPRAQHPLLQE